MLRKQLRWALLPLKTRLLSIACQRISRLPIGVKPSRLDITLLMLAWGNIGYAAGGSYLSHVGLRVTSLRGPILECGSGATTLLVAAITKNKGNNVVVLEHNREWFHYMNRTLKSLGFSHVHLVHAPLKRYDYYEWYSVPEKDLSSHISLVICDGPPGSIQGGRYGLMPIMESYLAPHCTILLDDTHREAERKIINAWRHYRNLEAHRLGQFGSHAEVTFGV